MARICADSKEWNNYSMQCFIFIIYYSYLLFLWRRNENLEPWCVCENQFVSFSKIFVFEFSAFQLVTNINMRIIIIMKNPNEIEYEKESCLNILAIKRAIW